MTDINTEYEWLWKHGIEDVTLKNGCALLTLILVSCFFVIHISAQVCGFLSQAYKPFTHSFIHSLNVYACFACMYSYAQWMSLMPLEGRKQQLTTRNIECWVLGINPDPFLEVLFITEPLFHTHNIQTLIIQCIVLYIASSNFTIIWNSIQLCIPCPTFCCRQTLSMTIFRDFWETRAR